MPDDPMSRVKALALQAEAWEAHECHVCTCPTCGVTFKLLEAALRKRGVSPEDTKRVSINPTGFGGASHPYLASVRVDGQEVYRIMDRPDEALAADVLRDVELALKGRWTKCQH